MSPMHCAPKIWKKLSLYEKNLWQLFYYAFVESHNFHTGWDTKEYKKQREVTAHNLALQAVWQLKENPDCNPLGELLDAMPDHFCRRGKKTEYALMIIKDKKGKWQILYGDLNEGTDSFSDDKNYASLWEAAENCKKYLTTRNWKR